MEKQLEILEKVIKNLSNKLSEETLRNATLEVSLEAANDMLKEKDEKIKDLEIQISNLTVAEQE